MTNCVDALASLLLENKKKLEESQLLLRRQQKFPPSTIVIIVYIVTQYLCPAEVIDLTCPSLSTIYPKLQVSLISKTRQLEEEEESLCVTKEKKKKGKTT